jgi:hypothetical protein
LSADKRRAALTTTRTCATRRAATPGHSSRAAAPERSRRLTKAAGSPESAVFFWRRGTDRTCSRSKCKPLAAWLAIKGAKPSKARAASAQLTGGELAALVGKPTFLHLAGEKRPVALFDWFVYKDQQQADEHTWLDELLEYPRPGIQKRRRRVHHARTPRPDAG